MLNLNYHQIGDGAPLLILHGLFGSLENWATIARRLSSTLTVFSVDLRNHGRSPHTAEMDYELMAGDVRDFLQQRNLTRAHLLGHSMGGKTAMRFAQLFPQYVDKLIVVDIAPKAYPPWHTEILEALCALPLSRFKSRPEVEEALSSAIPGKSVRRFLLKSLARDAQNNFFWRLNLESIRKNYEALSAELPAAPVYEGPALFLAGSRSDYLEPGDAELISSRFSAATVATIEGAGHWVHAEAPDQFVRVVSRFLMPDAAGET
jgi:pimeloyl-ACP methyl ester carboxylesterase